MVIIKTNVVVDRRHFVYINRTPVFYFIENLNTPPG